MNRLNVLKRTATQLEQAGAPELATKLRAVIGNATWPTPDVEATSARRAFSMESKVSWIRLRPLVLVTLGATLLPARRAAGTHPGVALRGQ
ncbi:MAG TPA: hypothetical protein VF128_03830 [Gemmatimonadaceae bacterium]